MARSFSRLVFRSALPLGFFFIVFGAKLLVIDKFGSDLPFWDQWDGEARMVFVPYFAGKLTLLHLFVPHNEHRIFFTKLLSLGLLVWNGQWDARLECVVNAALHAAILTALFAWARRQFGPLMAVLAFAILTAVTTPPLVWENTLGGFQSQFYFLIGFSFAAMWLWLASPAWSWQWWLAFFCALSAIFSMGSGFFCALPVIILLFWKLGLDRANHGAHLPTLIACSLIVVTGWILHTDVAYHISLHAHNARDFSVSFLRSAAWPKIEHPEAAWLLYLPFVLFFAWSLRRQQRNQAAIQFVSAGGLWVLSQIAATAYARGADGAPPAIRYGDILVLGVFFNGLALGLLAKSTPRKYLVVWMPLGLMWALTLANGIRFHTKDELRHGLPGKKSWSAASEKNVRSYVADGRFETTDSGTLPYPSATALASMLEQPAIRRILPASGRAPLAVEERSVSDISFARGAASPATPPLMLRKNWGSFTAGGPAAQGIWRSQPLPGAHGGFWQFEIAGDLGQPGLSLQLISAATGAVLAEVRPAKQAGDSWHSVRIRAPRETCVMVARDDSSTGWFAFSEPVEVADGSWLADKLAQNASWFLIIGGIFAIAGVAVTLRSGAGCAGISVFSPASPSAKFP